MVPEWIEFIIFSTLSNIIIQTGDSVCEFGLSRSLIAFKVADEYNILDVGDDESQIVTNIMSYYKHFLMHSLFCYKIL